MRFVMCAVMFVGTPFAFVPQCSLTLPALNHLLLSIHPPTHAVPLLSSSPHETRDRAPNIPSSATWVRANVCLCGEGLFERSL